MSKKLSRIRLKNPFDQYFLFVIPGLLIFTIGVFVPLVLAFRYSLTSWNGLTKNLPFVGLKNYAKMFTDPYVWDSWWFTFQFTFWNTVIQNLFALLFAVAIDSGIRLKKLYRTIFFIPCLISPVIVGFIWLRMFTNVLPGINEFLGTHFNMRLFGSGETVLGGLLIANNWQWIGYWMLIYLAALQSIPVSLYESAKVDGASKLSQFMHITLPMLAPAFTICIVGITVGSLKVYDLMVSSTYGGPGRSSTSIVYYIYNTALGGKQYGYGSALSISLVFVLLIVAVIQVGFLRRREVQA